MEHRIARRVEKLAESATLKMAQIAAQLKAEGKDVISLGIGEPDFNTPDHIKKAAINAINNNFTHYPPVSGFPDLRKAIASKYLKDYGLEYNFSQVVVSSGAKQSISNVILALLEPGDEIIVPAPYWVSYPDIIKLTDATMVEIKTTVESEFKITPLQLEKAITPKTRMLLLNSPSNPSGSIYSREDLEAFAVVLRKYPSVYILSDDIYEYINYKYAPTTIAQCNDMFERSIIVNGVSKGYAMTGWRIGYMLAPIQIAKACDKLQGHLTSGACSISQMAALEALKEDNSSVIKMVEQFRKRRDLVAQKLHEIPGLKFQVPDGAFYFFIDISNFIGKSYQNYNITDGDVMSEFILEHGSVSMVSGSAFGSPECVRISYAASEVLLLKACDRMKNALALLK
jgi:aspartate aminotransferase